MRAPALAAFLLAAAPPAQAAFGRPGELGVGVEVGEQNGGVLKYWLDGAHALDAGLGWSDGEASVHAGFLWHGWGILPKPGRGELALHLGPGIRHRGGEFGIRTVLGAAYQVADRPLEAFLEAGPVFRLNRGGGVDYTAVMGLRFHFPVLRPR